MERLLKKVSPWLDDQKDCAAQLRQLAREVDSLHGNCLRGKMAGAFLSMSGGLFGAAAGVVTAATVVVTGGLAVPFAVAAAGCVLCTAAGTGTTITTDMYENVNTKSSFRKAERLVEECKNGEEKIRTELQSLYQQGGGRCSTPRSQGDAVACIMRALEARQDMMPKASWLKNEIKKWQETVKPLIQPFIEEICILIFRFFKREGEKEGIAWAGHISATLGEAVGLIISGVITVTTSIDSLRDIFNERDRMDKAGQRSDAGNELRDAANKLEEAASKLNSDIEDVENLMKKRELQKRD